MIRKIAIIRVICEKKIHGKNAKEQFDELKRNSSASEENLIKKRRDES